MQFNVETLQKAFAYSLSSSQAQITEATNYLKQVLLLAVLSYIRDI